MRAFYTRLSQKLDDRIERGKTSLTLVSGATPIERQHLLSIKLDPIVCPHCLNSSHIELFKSFNGRESQLICAACGGVLCPFSIEQKIIDYLNNLTAFEGLKDFKSALTPDVRTDVLTLYSETGGAFVEKKYPFVAEYQAEVESGLRNLSLIAKETGMKNLEALVSQLVALN